MNVCTTGMPWPRASARSSAEACPRMAPLPAKISGNDAASMRRAAVWSAEWSGDGLLLGHVLGHLDVAGSGLFGLGQLERLADHLGYHRARLDACVPLCQRT